MNIPHSILKTRNAVRARMRGKIFFCSFFASLFIFSPQAFATPTNSPGVGSGAIGVDAGYNNISIGTPTTAADTRLLIVSSSTAGTYGLRITQPAGGSLFTVGSDGTITGLGSFNGASFNGSISAANVAADVFGRLQGNGNYAFPGSLGVGYASQVGLPQTFSVTGGGYFSGNVGIGTAAPLTKVTILDSSGVDDGTQQFTIGDHSGYHLAMGYANGGSTVGYIANTYTNADTRFDFRVGGITNNQTKMAILGDGNVGIGTTAPTASLHIKKLNPYIKMEDTGGAIAIFGVSNASDQVQLSGTYTGGNYRPFNISSGPTFIYLGGDTTHPGNVGIGTANPTAKLTIGGTAGVDGIKFPDGTLQTTASTGGTITGVTAGSGLTGGGTTGNVTVSVNYGSTAGTVAQGNTTLTGPAAGAGLSGGGGSIAVGTGGTFSSISLNLGSANTWTAAQTFNANTNFPGSGIWNTSGQVGVGTASVDVNYKLTLSGGGIKADVGSSANPASYFSNSGAGAAILVGSGTIVAGTGGITLGGVNKTSWPVGNAGTVTSITAGTGLSGGVITTSGTLSLNINGGVSQSCSGTDKISTLNANGTVVCTADFSGGTITGVTAGSGLTGGGTTGNVTVSVNYGSTAGTVAQGNTTLTGPAAGAGLSGGGGSIAVGTGGTFSSISLNLGSANTWTAAQTFNANTNFPGSGIWNTSGQVGVGTINPFDQLDVAKSTAGGLGGRVVITNSAARTDGNSTDLGFKVNNNFTATYYSARISAIQDAGATDNSSLAFFTYNAGAAGGSEKMRITSNGNVGIGTAAPTYKLDVASAGAATARFGTAATDGITVGGGAGKITAGTYDPLYAINGKKYATYLPGMTGQKEETAGVVRCHVPGAMCQEVIDFNTAPEGSDLWLFAKVTNLKNNFEKMTILLTPSFDGKAWYEKDPKNMELTIFAEPTTNYQLPTTNYEVSYRLTAPRFDAGKWSNNASATDAGLIIHE